MEEEDVHVLKIGEIIFKRSFLKLKNGKDTNNETSQTEERTTKYLVKYKQKAYLHSE